MRTLPSCVPCQTVQRADSPSTGGPLPSGLSFPRRPSLDERPHLSWAHRALCLSWFPPMPDPVLLAFPHSQVLRRPSAPCLVLAPWAPLGGAGLLRGPKPTLRPWPVGSPPGPGSRASPRRCLDYILEELKNNARAQVMVASHNEDTVRFTLRR